MAQVQVVVGKQAIGEPLMVMVQTTPQQRGQVVWTPPVITGTLAAGVPLTFTVSFTSSIALNGATLQVMGRLDKALSVTTSNLPATIAANQVVKVTLVFTSSAKHNGKFDGDVVVTQGKQPIPEPLHFMLNQPK